MNRFSCRSTLWIKRDSLAECRVLNFKTMARREHGHAQPRRGTVTACRFMVKHCGRWHRLFSDHARGLRYPHFILSRGVRILVDGVAP